jgi:hypothetical protein
MEHDIALPLSPSPILNRFDQMTRLYPLRRRQIGDSARQLQITGHAKDPSEQFARTFRFSPVAPILAETKLDLTLSRAQDRVELAHRAIAEADSKDIIVESVLLCFSQTNLNVLAI